MKANLSISMKNTADSGVNYLDYELCDDIITKKDFLCQMCNLAYNSKKKLSKHMSFHKGLTQLKCIVFGCKAKIFNKTDLKNHLINHRALGSLVAKNHIEIFKVKFT